MHDRNQATLTVVLLSLAFAALACADTIWVDCNNCGDPDADGSPEHPFCTIQEGIDAADHGDQVVVRDCTYTGVGNKNLDFGGKAITVRSENGPNCCTIDCEGNGRAFYFHTDEDPNSVVQGIEIKNGNRLDGGGVYIDGCRPTLRDCVFRYNSATGMAGSDGGAVFMRVGASSLIVNCTFADNYAADDGAALSTNVEANPTIVNCVFFGNVADGNLDYQGGGAVCNWESDPTFTNCTFYQNRSADNGGAIYNYSSNPTVTNCIFWGNEDNGEGTLESAQIHGGSPTVRYCCIQGLDSFAGNGNIGDDPDFVDPDNDDYHVLPNSPCIDAGDNTAVPIEITTDLDGNPRIAGGVVDMGAFESQPATQLVEIDIKPGSYPNSINLGSHGLVPTAILSSDSFDATAVDPASVTLAGAGTAVRGNGKHDMVHTQDVNGDGLMDLVIQVETENLNPDEFQDGYAILAGETFDGVLFEGFDEITIVPD